MKQVIGLLSWWDESPTWLAATVASFARVCDHIVALDGRYSLYDDMRSSSPQEQADAIAHAAYGAGIGLTLAQPRHTFADEMHKRTALFAHAAAVAEPYRDWFLILDADEVLDQHVGRGLIEHAIDAAESEGAPVVCGLLREAIDEHANEQRSRASRKMNVDPVTLAPSPRLWKAHRDMRVQGYHFHYSGVNADGERVTFWNRDEDGPREPWSICDELVVETRCLLRSTARLQQRKQYYADRDALGYENVSMHPDLLEATS